MSDTLTETIARIGCCFKVWWLRANVFPYSLINTDNSCDSVFAFAVLVLVPSKTKTKIKSNSESESVWMKCERCRSGVEWSPTHSSRWRQSTSVYRQSSWVYVWLKHWIPTLDSALIEAILSSVSQQKIIHSLQVNNNLHFFVFACIALLVAQSVFH